MPQASAAFEISNLDRAKRRAARRRRERELQAIRLRTNCRSAQQDGMANALAVPRYRGSGSGGPGGGGDFVSPLSADSRLPVRQTLTIQYPRPDNETTARGRFCTRAQADRIFYDLM